MTIEVILEKNLRFDRGGKPVEVTMSYEDFIDLTLKEKDSIREAEADRKAGRAENFVSMEDLEKELGV